MTIAMNFIQECYRSKRSGVVRWPLKKCPVTTSIWVKSFSCNISFQNKQQLKLFINSEHHLEKKVETGSLLPVSPSATLLPTLACFYPTYERCVCFFKFVCCCFFSVFVLSYISFISIPSLFQTAVRKPMPQRSRSSVIIGKMKNKMNHQEY